MNHLSKFILLLVMLVSMQVQARSVDINTASAGVLASAIDGVGENKAANIVAYRDANGPFTSVDELTNVKGIGAATIDKNRDNLTVAVPGDLSLANLRGEFMDFCDDLNLDAVLAPVK